MYSNRGCLTVDLSAITHNWRVIAEHVGADVLCGAVVKANAYGLGVLAVAPSLADAGCRHFFVANLSEAIELRAALGAAVTIYVLLGFAVDEESQFVEHDLVPIITSLVMFERWLVFVGEFGVDNLRAGIKVNTGMTRLGLDVSELQTLIVSRPQCLRAAGIALVMSHLACADNYKHPLNQQQINLFRQVESQWKAESTLPIVKFSLANSAAALLLNNSHFDLVRPGIALYGGCVDSDAAGFENKLRTVVRLRLPVMQLRHVAAGEVVGYGATFYSDADMVVATVAGGYADGVFRALSNKAWGYLNGVQVPLVGRVSMDSCLFDITKVYSGDWSDEPLWVEILGEFTSIDELAALCDTIGYEVLTSLGSRYQCTYLAAV